MHANPDVDPREADLGDLVSSIMGDARELVQAEVVVVKDEVAQRVAQVERGVETWLVIGGVAVVASVLFGLALADTLAGPVGLPRYLAQWIVTALAAAALALLIVRARRASHAAVDPSTEPRGAR
jgi:hypothetical protein